MLQSKDEKGEPYFITDDQDKPVLDAKGKPIPAFKPVAVDVGTPGVLRNGYREISKGIKPDDLVVVLGMQKIRLGTNPVTKEPYLVAARPFDPEKDLAIQVAARPAHQSRRRSNRWRRRE